MHPSAAKNIRVLSEICAKEGSVFDSSSYLGCRKPVSLKCKCGAPVTIYRAEALLSGNNLPLCKACAKHRSDELKKEAGARTRATSPVKDWIANYCAPFEVTPHLDTYAGPTANMEFTCKCGSPITRNVMQLKRGLSPLCHPCGRNQGRLLPKETILGAFESRGLRVVGDVRAVKDLIEYECPVEGCTKTNSVLYSNLLKEGAKNFYCHTHFNELAVKRGPAHPLWNPEREERDRTLYLFVPWSKAVLASWGYRCAITGKSGRLEAHHLNSRRRFPEDALRISNGVALSSDLHWEFHQEFCGGTVHGSTLEQFQAFYLFKTGRPFEPLSTDVVVIAQDEIPGPNQLRPTDVEKVISHLYSQALNRLGLRKLPGEGKLSSSTSSSPVLFTPKVFG